MALSKIEIDILRMAQGTPDGITPGDFIRLSRVYDERNLITARLAMKRLEEQGWMSGKDVNRRIRSYGLTDLGKKVDFGQIEAV